MKKRYSYYVILFLSGMYISASATETTEQGKFPILQKVPMEVFAKMADGMSFEELSRFAQSTKKRSKG